MYMLPPGEVTGKCDTNIAGLGKQLHTSIASDNLLSVDGLNNRLYIISVLMNGEVT